MDLLRHLKNMIVFHFTMDDNPSLTPEYIRDMKASFTGIFYQRFILGEWTNAEGAIYDGWDPAKHVIAWADLPPMYRLLGSHGLRHPACHLGGAPRPRVRPAPVPDRRAPHRNRRTLCAQRTVAAGEDDRRLAETPHLPENNGLRPERLIADQAALAHRRELYESQGIATEPADKEVTYGIGLVSSLLAHEIDGIPMLRVSDRCKGIIGEVPGYVWDAKKAEHGEDAPVKQNDDSMDMWRYAVTTTEFDWRDQLLTIDTRF
jgi:hypothetical protein